MKKFDIVTIFEIILTIILGLLAFFMLPLIGLPIVAVCIVTVFILIVENS